MEMSGLIAGKRGDEGERTTLTFSEQKCQGCPRALCPFPNGNGPGQAPEDHWNTNKTVHSKNGQRVARAYASCYGRLDRLPADERESDGGRTTLTFPNGSVRVIHGKEGRRGREDNPDIFQTEMSGLSAGPLSLSRREWPGPSTRRSLEHQ